MYSLTIVPAALVQKRMCFKRYAIAIVATTTISSLTAVGAAIMGAGVWALVVRQVLYHAVLVCLIWWIARDFLSGLMRRPAVDQHFAGRRGGRWFLLLATADLGRWVVSS